MKRIIELSNQKLCCGCGICASICPKGCLEMTFTNNGMYLPRLINSDSCIKCNLCEKSCSQIQSKENQYNETNDNSLNYKQGIGFFTTSYVGYTTKENNRLLSASGGITTALLKHLLDNKIVDFVITACKTSNKHPLISPICINSSKDLDNCTGSYYYPISYSEIIKHIINNDGTYAIVGLPCIISSITKASKYNVKLKNRIKFKIGLTCGSNKTAAYLDYVVFKEIGDYTEIRELTFRHKVKGTPASNYCIKIRSDKYKKSFILNNHIWGKYFGSKIFDLPSCSYCDDVFAEDADICLMDAWLPRYIKDYKGTNFIICRNKQLCAILEAIPSCKIKEVNIDDIIYSQKEVATPIVQKQIINPYYSTIYPHKFKKSRFDVKSLGWLNKKKIKNRHKGQQIIISKYNIFDSKSKKQLEQIINKVITINNRYSLIQRVNKKIIKIAKKIKS